ncbi:MAG: VanZ family protein [Deltaproteobacteria bacterium]
MTKNAWVGVAALVLYSGFIFYLSSIPTSKFPFPSPLPDKLIHIFIYFGLGAIFNYLLNNLKIRLSQAAMAAAALIFLTAYGFGDEFHQTYTAGRTFDPLDLVADVVGGICAHLIFQGIRSGD